jgi:hypothetical protein
VEYFSILCRFENTEDCAVESSLLTKLDGNAIILNGWVLNLHTHTLTRGRYNRDTLIQDNEFVWIGNTAVALWGYTNYWDGTGMDQAGDMHLLSFDLL